VLLGDGPLRSSILNLRYSLGLEACVHLPGFKQYPVLPAYYGLAGAFVHASTKEPWGLVVNEAMASGLPVLVSNRCGCARDLVQEGVNGFTFDPYNIEEMANAMMQVWSREQGAGCGKQNAEMLKAGDTSTTLAEMGDASRAIISEWGPEQFAKGLKAAAEKAIEVGPQRASWMTRFLLRALLFR
jgi:glycosyltransferase involved in cell wall biosynthesis